MPAQKDLKRIIRSRMEKTGESYTAARRHIVSRKNLTVVPPPPPDYASVAGMADATIKTKTGRSWAEWVELLDAFGGKEKPHRDIAAHVFSHGVDGWWAQSVTVGYERIRGLRERGQRRGGMYEASKSKTFPVAVDKLFDAFANARTRKRWLGDVKLKVRTAAKPKSMRITWDDGTSVDLWFQSKGPAKSIVAVQHVKLASREDIDRRKQFWSEKLDALAKLLSK
ncbi:MAG TPA: hypothetical protein VNA69_15690 [Thermoanaerobaculia bacterium]|nr:hypothetical protein [Thermoanaerobaculia bacterium]